MRCFFATFLATAALVIPFAHGQQTSKDRLESEILPSFQSILNVDENGVCAAEPGPAVCSAQVSSIATKMTEVNSYTSFDTYVDTLMDASLFFKHCWSYFVSDLKSNTFQIEQLCGALEDASYTLKHVYYQATLFPTSLLCTELLTDYGDHKSEFTAETRAQSDVSISAIYTFPECRNFEGKIEIIKPEVSRQSSCAPKVGTNLKTAVNLGEKALGIMMRNSSKLPHVSFGFAVMMAIYDYVCTNGKESAATLDANSVYSIGREASKDLMKNVIEVEMTTIHNFLKADVDYYGHIRIESALLKASEYMALAFKAGVMGIKGYQTAVGCLSHSVSLLGMAKENAINEGQSECVKQIDIFFENNLDSIQNIEHNAKEDLKELGKELKGKNLQLEYVKMHPCYTGYHYEYKAWSVDRRSSKIRNTIANWGGDWDWCHSTETVIANAKSASKKKVDKWLKEKEEKLFTKENNDLFKNIRDPVPRPAPVPRPTPYLPPTPFPPHMYPPCFGICCPGIDDFNCLP
jgi:hypothetical protein